MYCVLLYELELDITSELRCPVEDDLLLKRQKTRQIIGSENHTVFIKVRRRKISRNWLDRFQNSIRFSYFGDHFHRNNVPKSLCLFNFMDKDTHLCNIFRLGICETQPPASIGWVALSSLFGCSFVSVTAPLIPTIWCFWPYKPYIFCEDMILATCQHHNLKPYTFQSEFRIVYCCLV